MPKLPATLTELPCTATAARKATRRLTQLYDDALGPSGLRSTQVAILAELDLRAGDPPTMRELAESLVMDRSSLGHTLRPLERDGLIAFEQSTEDRRRQYVALTRAGKAKFRAASRLWEAAQKRFEDVFGEPEAAKLRATLLSIAHDDRLARLKD
jgi:DNA-binding MarR family transcriptional regulator